MKLNIPKTKIDLRVCKPGDYLISSLKGVLVYESNNIDIKCEYPHYIRHKYLYKNGSFIECSELGQCSRTDGGYVYRFNRIPEIDHDIIYIIPKKQFTFELAEKIIQILCEN